MTLPKGKLIGLGILAILIIAAVAYSFAAQAAYEADVAEYRANREKVINEQKAELDPIIFSIVKNCESEEGLNKSLCLGESATRLSRKGFSGSYTFGNTTEGSKFYEESWRYYVRSLCESDKENSDVCYFYVAAVSQKSDWCSYVGQEEQLGCRLISSDRTCNYVDNRYWCNSNRARLLRYIDKDKSKRLCDQIRSSYPTPPEGYDDVTCDDINFGEEDYDSWSLKTRVMLAYFYVMLANFQIKTVYVE